MNSLYDPNIQLSSLTKEEIEKGREEKKEVIAQKKLYEQSLYDTLVNTKDAYYSVFDDILKGDIKYPYYTVFTKNNRLYYIGIGLVIIVFILMIYNSLVFSNKTEYTPIMLRIDQQ